MPSQTLAQPLTLPCGAVLKNRLAKAAMTEGLADANDHATAEHAHLYRQWAQGGAGLLITGNVMIDPRFLERPGNVVAHNKEGLNRLSAWAAAATENNTHCWMQISHPGRQCARIVSNQPMSPSDVQLNLLGNFAKPKAMTIQDIQEAIEGYARTASIAKEAGFTGVQIHAAHGYLINQFLSPITNQRTDEWGGDLTHRARFLLAVVDAVRNSVGSDFPVAVKLNSADFQKGGFNLEDSAQVATWLEQAGIDLLEISGGAYEQLRFLGHTGDEDQVENPKINDPEIRESTRVREAYFLEYAKQIKKATQLPLMVTGGFRQVDGIVHAVANDGIAVIGLGRPLCTLPNAPKQLLDGAITELPDESRDLKFGRGLLGNNSSNATIKALNAQGNVAWYYQQILRLAKLQTPSKSKGILLPLIKHFGREYYKAIRRKF